MACSKLATEMRQILSSNVACIGLHASKYIRVCSKDAKFSLAGQQLRRPELERLSNASW